MRRDVCDLWPCDIRLKVVTVLYSANADFLLEGYALLSRNLKNNPEIKSHRYCTTFPSF